MIQPAPLPIKGFWHIYLVNHWYSIVMDQLRIMLTSGLYDACDEINIGCLGSHEEKILLNRLVVEKYPKLNIKFYSTDAAMCEFPTLERIQLTYGNYAGFYFHTKAVTHPFDTIANHWRGWLNEAVLNRWQEHYNNIVIGYDVSSVNHCTPPQHPEHFSGNFWWFNRAYIVRLPNIHALDWGHRWNAEQWICRCRPGMGRYYAEEFVEPGTNTFIMKHS